MNKGFKLIAIFASLGFMMSSYAQQTNQTNEPATNQNNEQTQTQGNVAATTADQTVNTTTSTTYNANHLDSDEEMD
jgi:hypothetical protein